MYKTIVPGPKNNLELDNTILKIQLKAYFNLV